MKSACFVVIAGILSLAGCSQSPETPKPAPVAKHRPPIDESRKMPSENRTSSELIADHMFDRPWLPGGTVGHYKKQAKQWDLILVKCDSAPSAADWLLGYKKELDGAKLIPSFGGFYGSDKGRPMFVFTKNDWFAAVAGLPQADADLVARDFAARFR